MSLGGDITMGGLPSFTTTIPTVLPGDLLATAGGAFFTVLPDTSGNSSFTAVTPVCAVGRQRNVPIRVDARRKAAPSI